MFLCSRIQQVKIGTLVFAIKSNVNDLGPMWKEVSGVLPLMTLLLVLDPYQCCDSMIR